MTTSHNDIAAAVRLLTVAAEDLNVAALDITGMTWEETAEVLKATVAARQVVQKIEAGMERWIAQAWRNEDLHGNVEVPGVGVVTVRRGKDRKAWDHQALAHRILDAHLRVTGEVPSPTEVAGWLLGAAGISYWKVTTLKDLGIDVDEFCDTSPGPVSVAVQ